MAEAAHKYFCGYCNIFIFGETAARLAGNLKSHNTTHYWPPMSEQESQKEVKALPQYTTSYGTTSKSGDWGDAENPPDITLDDIRMLAMNGVKW